MDVPTPEDFVPTKDNEPTLTYDPEWLAITRAFHPYLSNGRMQPIYPDEEAARGMIEKELEWVKSHVRNSGNEKIGGGSEEKLGMRDVADCQVFVKTAPGPGSEGEAKFQQREFCVFLSSSMCLCYRTLRGYGFISYSYFFSPIAPWYTNPQTVAFCGMLEIENKINPPPSWFHAPSGGTSEER